MCAILYFMAYFFLAVKSTLQGVKIDLLSFPKHFYLNFTPLMHAMFSVRGTQFHDWLTYRHKRHEIHLPALLFHIATFWAALICHTDFTPYLGHLFWNVFYGIYSACTLRSSKRWRNPTDYSTLFLHSPQLEIDVLPPSMWESLLLCHLHIAHSVLSCMTLFSSSQGKCCNIFLSLAWIDLM